MAKVLLADDSITIHKVVEIILTAKGFTLKAVGDGETALEEVRSFKPDVVLADIEMPGLTGYELSEKIKKNPSTKDIPIILLAGAFETIDNALVHKSGASSILIKPFESEDLIGKIREVVSPEAVADVSGGSTEPSGEVLKVEGLEAEAEEELEEISEEEPFEEMPEMAGFEEFDEAEAELTAVEEPEEVLEAEAELTEVEEPEVVMEAEDELTAVEEPEEVLEAEAELTAVEEPEEVLEAEAELTAVEEPEEAIGMAEPEPVGLEEIAEETYAEPSVAVPGAGVLSDAFRRAADEQIAAFIGSLDMKELMKDALAPTLGEAVEKVLWEIVPELTEKLARETLQESMKNLKKELETVIWETVPELAEKIINKEIQRIREEK
jgi:CheY-like chemotaxis protein